MVSKDEINHSIATLPINEAVDSLIQKALDNGANDNVSVILIKGETDAAFASQSQPQDIV